MLDPNRIEELARGIDYHTRGLTELIGELQEVKKLMEKMVSLEERKIASQLNNMEAELKLLRKQMKPSSSSYKEEFEILRQLTKEGSWPQAVDSNQVCMTSEEIERRAKGILDLVVSEHLKDLSFLDFGCGTGHVVIEAASRETKQAVGYDIKVGWNEQVISDRYQLTTNAEEVKSKAPYDIILIHDVLDHLEAADPVDILKQLKAILKPNGRIYVRNHPWISRHGGHLYHTINLAFMHLIFDEMELTRLGGYTPNCSHSVRLPDPLGTYRSWFQKAGLKVEHEIPVNTGLDDFFHLNQPLLDRITKHIGLDQLENLGLEFVEYTLCKANAMDHLI